MYGVSSLSKLRLPRWHYDPGTLWHLRTLNPDPESWLGGSAFGRLIQISPHAPVATNSWIDSSGFSRKKFILFTIALPNLLLVAATI